MVNKSPHRDFPGERSETRDLGATPKIPDARGNASDSGKSQMFEMVCAA